VPDYTRISTSKAGITITSKGGEYKASSLSLASLGTAAKIKDEIAKALVTQDKEGKQDVFVHVNRKGTIVIAIGVEPKVWPEDDVL